MRAASRNRSSERALHGGARSAKTSAKTSHANPRVPDAAHDFVLRPAHKTEQQQGETSMAGTVEKKLAELGIARGRQENKPGWASKRQKAEGTRQKAGTS